MSDNNELDGMSLMDIAGLDTTNLQGKSFGDVFPRAVADFQLTKTEIAGVEDSGKLRMALAKFEFTCLACHSVAASNDGSPTIEADSLVGKVHTEICVIKGQEGVEFCLGFLDKLGGKQRGKLQDVMRAKEGIVVRGVVKHRVNRDDPDQVFARLDKIKVLQPPPSAAG